MQIAAIELYTVRLDTVACMHVHSILYGVGMVFNGVMLLSKVIT